MIQKTSYVTIDAAQFYFNGRLNTDQWDGASIEDKNKALIQASTDIDKLQYSGEKVDYQAEHEFPRKFTSVQFDIIQYDTDNIPIAIKYAVCEQALALLDGWDVTQEIDALSTVSAGYSGVRNTFDRNTPPMHLRCGLCPQAWQNILAFLADNRSIAIYRV